MPTQTLALTHQGGELKDNQAELGAVSTKSFTVPSGKRWLCWGGYVERDQNATIQIDLYNSSNELIGTILNPLAAGTTNFTWGFNTATAYFIPSPIPMKAGDYVKLTWGASQTTPKVSLIISQIGETL